MKVLSVLFVGLVLCLTFVSTASFADVYTLGSANAENGCLTILSISPAGTLVRKGHCLKREPVDPHIISMGPGGCVSVVGKPREYKCDAFSAVTDPTTGKRSVKHHNFSFFSESELRLIFSDEESTLTTPTDQGSSYSTQPTDRKNGLNTNEGSTVSNRLFIAGTRNTPAANDYLAYALDSEGLPTGAKSVIFSNPTSKTTLGGSISRDGGMAVQLTATTTSWTLNSRLLNNGIPRKAPFSWTVPAYSGYSPDLTNSIEINGGGAGASALKIRYLVYRVFRGVGTAAQQSQIMIQRLDDATGQPLEAAKPLTVFKNAFQAPAESLQSLAIAPNGEFLIFTEYSGACKKMIIKAARLVNGVISGPTKVIAGCAGLAQTPAGWHGIDLMQLPETETSTNIN